MFIETEGTPNPATLKFLPGRDVMGAGTADFAAAHLAERSPLARALFDLPGVARVFLGGEFVTVTKSDDEDWQSLPYEPTLRGDRLYGRGAADDKAGVMSHISAIRALHSVVGDDLDVGIVLFVEGEEEFLSRSLGAILERFHDRLKRLHETLQVPYVYSEWRAALAAMAD